MKQIIKKEHLISIEEKKDDRFGDFLIKNIMDDVNYEYISLIKMTSIVVYIVVQDITKASDIIRSRTFEVFFPLIFVAILYFAISWLLMALFGYFEKISDPKIRTLKLRSGNY